MIVNLDVGCLYSPMLFVYSDVKIYNTRHKWRCIIQCGLADPSAYLALCPENGTNSRNLGEVESEMK